MNKNLREKLANQRNEFKENTEKESVLVEKINHLRGKIDELIIKKTFQNQNKQNKQQKTKKKQQKPTYILKIHC